MVIWDYSTIPEMQKRFRLDRIRLFFFGFMLLHAGLVIEIIVICLTKSIYDIFFVVFGGLIGAGIAGATIKGARGTAIATILGFQSIVSSLGQAAASPNESGDTM